MDSSPTNQPCSKNIMTSISSDATYSSTNTTTTISSSTNMITSILTIGHHVTRQNKIPTHAPIIQSFLKQKKFPTIHILKTLCKFTTITTPCTSIAPWLYTHPKTTLPSKTSNQPSTTALKPNTKYSTTTPTKQTTPPSKHLSFTFYLIPNRPNDISNLNFPKNLAKFYSEIQRNAKLSITKIVN